MYDALALHIQTYNDIDYPTIESRCRHIMSVKNEADAALELLNTEQATAQAADDAAAEAARLQALKPVWEQELIDERAGHNRAEVIAELEANIASVPVV